MAHGVSKRGAAARNGREEGREGFRSGSWSPPYILSGKRNWSSFESFLGTPPGKKKMAMERGEGHTMSCFTRKGALRH